MTTNHHTTLAVREVPGEPLRFWVQGNDQPEYLVDLASYRGNGMCGCVHFEMRCAKDASRGFKARCKHIEAAREHALDAAIARYAQEAGQGSSEGVPAGAQKKAQKSVDTRGRDYRLDPR